MTHTTTDAAEARAREVLAQHLDASGFAALAKSARGTGLESMVAAMLSFATAEAASGAGEREGRFWLIVREPGKVPERKGPWPHREAAHRLREFIAARPRAFIDVLTIGHDGTPEVEHGPEVLQYTDGRSMSVGRKHNQRVRDAAEEALASLPPATDPAIPDGWKLVPVEPTGEMAAAGVAAINDTDLDGPSVWSAMLAAAPTIPATGEAIASEEKPYPELLSTAEHQALLTVAEEMWRALQTNNLGGSAGRNRPFYILHEFRRVIEMFGHRDTGLKWSKNDLGAHSKATIPATGHAETEGEGA